VSGPGSGSELLLDAWREPDSVYGFTLSQWDRLIPLARQARLLASLAARLDGFRGLAELPQPVQSQLLAARAAATEDDRALRWEVNRICRALRGTGVPVLLLKGAAYSLAGLSVAQGRVAADVDILVPRAALQAAEAALRQHGWEPAVLDRYDERYYRAWSHELPPLRHRDRRSIVDVHHALFTESGGSGPDPDELWRNAVRLPDAELSVLDPSDMVLHSALHLFYGELHGGLRDLVDLDGLLRHFVTRPGFVETLGQRAARFRLTRPLFYAVRYSRALLGTPFPHDGLGDSHATAPGSLVTALMDRIVPLTLLPADGPERVSPALASALALARSHWLKMPAGRLAAHLLRKSIVRWRRG
jgi:hypothetical protein